MREPLWGALLAAGEALGLVPAGLASRDTLRLEAGMPLYGHELSLDIVPAQAGLGRVVNFDKEGDFVGRAALEHRDEHRRAGARRARGGRASARHARATPCTRPTARIRLARPIRRCRHERDPARRPWGIRSPWPMSTRSWPSRAPLFHRRARHAHSRHHVVCSSLLQTRGPLMADKTQFKYTAEHEWIPSTGTPRRSASPTTRPTSSATSCSSICPTVGSSVTAGKVVGEIESTKSVGELFAPIDGAIVESTTPSSTSPELVNSDPFGEGWMIKITASRPADLNGPTFLTYDGYTAL